LNIESLGLLDTREFGQANACGTVLMPQGTCEVSLSFTPASSGSRFTNLVIVTDDEDNPISTVRPLAVGKAGTLTVTPVHKEFGQHLLRTEHEQAFTFHNERPGGVILTGVSFAGTRGQFAHTNDCPELLLAQES